MKRRIQARGWGSSVFLAGLLGSAFGCSASTIDQTEQELVGECTTTSQCKRMYSGATDCRNSEGGICYCATEVRDTGATADPDPGPDPDPDVSTPVRIPARLFAKNFVDARDLSSGNAGGKCPSDVDPDVDMQLTSDPQGNVCNVGWTQAGEYLEYDISVGTSQKFDIGLRLAAQTAGKSVAVYIDGNLLGRVTAPGNGWQAFATETLSNKSVSAGNHRVRVAFEGGGVNFNFVQFTASDATPAPEPAPANFRIAISADGNQHDADDWHSSPMMLALLHQAGLKNALVHFDYNNHLGANDSSMATTHKNNIMQLVDALGYDRSRFFNDQGQLSSAVTSLKNAINASTASDRLILICAGPMEVCYRGIDAASDTKEQYVTVLSHSTWNDNHQDTAQMSHTWSSIKNDFSVQDHHINDQNPPAFKSDCSAWNWLHQLQGYGDSLYTVMCTGNKAGDASDAGMMWYVIAKNGALSGSTGTSSPTMAQVKSFFGI